MDSFRQFQEPQLPPKAALKMTDVELNLFTYIAQHLYTEEGIRGGVAIISHRYA